MSKYHKGDKFIIEISKNDTNEPDTTEYYIINGSRVYEKEELDRLQKYEEQQIPYSEAYNKGLNDAWELAKKIVLPPSEGGMEADELKIVYRLGSYSVVNDILKEYTPQEAIAKLEAYEKEQNEMKVGDVVTVCGEKGIVVGYLCGLEEYEVWMDGYERPQRICKNEIKKTGKHIDIQSLLEQIKE